MVDRNTKVVGVAPDLSKQQFVDILRAAGSPAAATAGGGYDLIAAHNVSPTYALAVFDEESTLAKNPTAIVVTLDTKNPGNRRTSRTGKGRVVQTAKGPFVKYDTWQDGWEDLAYSLADPGFVYVQEGRDLIGEIIPRWAPASDSNDPEAYIQHVVNDMNHWLTGTTPPTGKLVFGNLEHPPFVDRLIPDVQTSAWDDLGARVPVGVCQHSMVGSLWGTDGWFRRGRQSTGLTDYGIGGSTDGAQWDGVILRWNDPLGRATTITIDGVTYVVSGNRSGWANGGSDGLEGDGPLFVRTFGIGGINRLLVSIERSDGGDTSTAMSPKQLNSIVALTAYWFDWAKVPWDRFPLNPAHELVTHLLHLEFATKTCPHPPVTNRIDEIQARVRELLKAGQVIEGGTEPIPLPPPPVPAPTPQPDHGWWPAVYTRDGLKDRWGTMRRHNVDGGISLVPFSDKSALVNAWAARGGAEEIAEGQLPEPLDWWALVPGEADEPSKELALFDGGWTLYRPAPNAAYRWIQ